MPTAHPPRFRPSRPHQCCINFGLLAALAACSTGAPPASVDGGTLIPDAAMVVTDASVAADASPTPDAAPLPDAAQPDAALPPDAGVTALDASTPDAHVPTDAGDGTWRSVLYPVDWAPGRSDDAGRMLQDYSFAGYRGGEDPPVAAGTVFNVLDHAADSTGMQDSRAAVQAAVDTASMTGGTVLFPAGTYRLDGPIQVQASNVVLRGAGVDQTFLKFTTPGPSHSADITFGAAPGSGTNHALVQDGARFDTVLAVEDATGLTAGMDVAVGFTITPEFVQEHGMDGTWQAFNGNWQPIYRRTIVAVETNAMPHTVTLDVPLRDPVRVRDGASIRVETGILREVGVEELSVTNTVTRAQAWSMDQKHLLAFKGVADGWIRRVHSYGSNEQLQSSGFLVLHSKRVTIQECQLGRAQNRGPNGNGYLFELRQSSEILLRDNVGRAGRHNFIQNWGFGTTGCVFLRCHSLEGRAHAADWDPIGLPAPSEFHHSLATANLIDQSVLDDGWAAGNRGSESSGAGHSARENVFWNVRGAGTIRSLQFGHGYVLGTQDVSVVTDPGYVSFGLSGNGTAPEDFVEGRGQGATLRPTSLYEDQRRRRLGL